MRTVKPGLWRSLYWRGCDDIYHKQNGSVNEGLGLCDITIDDIQVMQILDKLREDNAAGADELVPRFFSKIRHQLARPLSTLFNNIIKSGQVTADWKEANVVPVFKGKR